MRHVLQTIIEESSFLLRRSKAFALETLISLPAAYTFHSIEHTKQVARAAMTIGLASQLSADQLESVMIAAWFHDVGYCNGPEDHEERSASIAKKMLTAWGAPSKKVADVSRSILATKIPQNPKDIVGMVLCDADLSHLSSTRYEEHLSTLRKEQETILGVKVDNEQMWYKQNIEFLKAHHYFTDYGKEILDRRKKVIFNKMKKQLDTSQV